MTLTEAEIRSQPGLWRRASTEPVPDFLTDRDRRMLVIGCGTSAFMAMSYADLRERAGYGETDWAYASEVKTGRHYDTLLALTRSGTTTEIIEAVRALDADTTVALTAVPGGPLTSLVDHTVVLDYADEQSIVQTRFPTTALTLLRTGVGADGESAVADCEAALGDPIPVEPADHDHFVFLGTGWTVGLAYEAALKMRESAQAWAESYPAMDYRHGPIAVAGPRSLVWILGSPPPGLVDEVESTGARVLTGSLDPLAQLVQVQRFAVATAAARGLDPDHPRALSRSVVLAP
ncbi:MAG TPA: SIS domain-containing protein [Nocardioides sp.]|jgi:fructoselysine-6-P-deglycase FrlB-like protein|nr:SIS domain-containing protein [Nocardioides sp.]